MSLLRDYSGTEYRDPTLWPKTDSIEKMPCTSAGCVCVDEATSRPPPVRIAPDIVIVFSYESPMVGLSNSQKG
jgi:hypothetical protein